MIVVAGEALIDLVPQGAGALAGLLPLLGGGPYNTAVALGRLGSPTAFCSRVSRDAFGEALLAGLTGAGVDVSSVQRGDEPTTLAAATIGPDGSAAYSFYVEGTADRLFSTPVALPDAARAVSFGTCSLVLEPGASAYEELMRKSAAQGVFTALDPNIRGKPDPGSRRLPRPVPELAPLGVPAEAVRGGRRVARRHTAGMAGRGTGGRGGHPGWRRAHRLHPGRFGALRAR